MILLLVLGVFSTIAIVVASVHAIFEDRRVLNSDIAVRIESSLALLHSINADRCIGCEGCIDVCPTKVLALVHHKVQVVNFKDCVQCEQCVWACPTMALVMHREGTKPQSLTVPEIDAHFQTSVPGQYLIGEVAGKPLVKNAANLGRLVVEHMLRDGLQASSPDDEVLDVAIVGSGPGGLSAGLASMHHGLRCVILEKEHTIASTVSRYPKGKSFMSEPADARNLSFLPVFDASKEKLLASWKALIAEVDLPIQKGEAVEDVKRRDDGIFEIRTTVTSYLARRVILATGLRGKPRLLAVPGANLAKVHSVLEDPEAYSGQAVLVVGGGDSALEAAMALSDAGSTVTLSYRSKAFKRAKIANQKKIQEYGEAGTVRVLMSSNATSFAEATVSIKLSNGEEETIDNQQAFLLIGAEAPVAWLEKLGVRFVQRPHLYELGAVDKLVIALVQDVDDCPSDALPAAARIRGEHVMTAPPTASPRRQPRQRSVIEFISDEWTKVRTVVRDLVEYTPAPEILDEDTPFLDDADLTAIESSATRPSLWTRLTTNREQSLPISEALGGAEVTDDELESVFSPLTEHSPRTEYESPLQTFTGDDFEESTIVDVPRSAQG